MATDPVGGVARYPAHAPIAAPGPRSDGRSVGELLRDADHLARELLLDLTADDAPGMLRSWGRLVEAAGTAWESVAKRATPTARAGVEDVAQSARPDNADPMARLRAVTDGITGALERARWPGPGVGDPHLEAIAVNLDRVTYLVDQLGHDLPVGRPEVRADLAAAQMRLMHTVYLGAHATNAALQQYGRRLYRDSQGKGRSLQLARIGRPYAVGPTARWVQRLDVCEATAGRYVGRVDRGFAAVLAGEAATIPEGPGRLHQALANWDVFAHRALTGKTSAADLVLASRTQGLIAVAALVLFDAASRARNVPQPGDPDRIGSAVAASGEAWSQLARRWADLATTGSHADPDLSRAAAQLRAACRELTHDGAGKASPEQIGARADLGRLVESLQQALEAAVDLAHMTRDAAADPDLTGPARPLSRRAHDDVERAIEAGSRTDRDEDVVWVTPQDVQANKLVPLPRPVAEGLQGASVNALTKSHAAMTATTTITGSSPPRDVKSRSVQRPALLPEGCSAITSATGRERDSRRR